MTVAIQVVAKDDAKAWDILVRHSKGMALRDHVFIVSDDAARALKKAGVRFKELARDGTFTLAEGGRVGKRI